MHHTTRRRFLMASLGATALWASSQGSRLLGPTRQRSEPGAPPVVRTSRAIGTEVTITVVHAPLRDAQRAIDAAFAEIKQVEDVLSLYRPDSQLSRLNRDSAIEEAHPYLLAVLNASLSTSRRSGGAFDVTVQPLWELYARAARQGALPANDRIETARRLIDWRRVQVAGRSVRMLSAGMAITFNGIAQGFATDRAKAVLASYGVQHALIDVGELTALGRNAAAAPWTIGIQHPRTPDAYVAVTRLEERSLATSADYATRFTPEYSRHHIFDPATGLSPTDLASVSVLARTAMEADALSTAAFVLGADKGTRFLEQTPGADALFVLKNGVVIRTDGFPRVL